MLIFFLTAVDIYIYKIIILKIRKRQVIIKKKNFKH